jgi:hypothetical protein
MDADVRCGGVLDTFDRAGVLHVKSEVIHALRDAPPDIGFSVIAVIAIEYPPAAQIGDDREARVRGLEAAAEEGLREFRRAADAVGVTVRGGRMSGTVVIDGTGCLVADLLERPEVIHAVLDQPVDLITPVISRGS